MTTPSYFSHSIFGYITNRLRTVGVVFFILVISCVPPVFAAEEVPAPSINIAPDTFYPLDEVLYMEGRATPMADVRIMFQKQGSAPVNFTIKADQNGEWSLTEKVLLETGDWEVRARIMKDGTVSEWSNPRLVRAVVSGFNVGSFQVKYVSIALILVAILGLGIALSIYFAHRIRKLRKQLLEKETDEVRHKIIEGFDEIRSDILSELQGLESRQGERQLNASEIARREHLLKELHTIQDNIEKEVRDVEKLG